jgi:predicted Zn-dependent protease
VYRYGLALSHLRLDQSERARAVLEPLVRAEPRQMAFALALAQARARSGAVEQALADLGAIVRDFPRNRAATIAYADELIATGQSRNARKAISALRPLLALNDEDPLLQHAFARANELAGEEVRAGEAHAEVALLNGRFDDALQQLNALLQRTDVDYYQRARIQARIEIVTPYAIEQRRRQQAGTEPGEQRSNALIP